MDIVQEKFLVQKIAEYKHNERVAKGIGGDADHDWRMAEMELANYLLFKNNHTLLYILP